VIQGTYSGDIGYGAPTVIPVINLDSSCYPRIYRNHRYHYNVPMLPLCRHELTQTDLHALGSRNESFHLDSILVTVFTSVW